MFSFFGVVLQIVAKVILFQSKPHQSIYLQNLHEIAFQIRGGVEDTRLEAKAKDTKNFEAKAKDRPSQGQGQGPRTQSQVFSKKKGLQNFFSGKKVFKNFFSGDLLQIFHKVSGVFQRNFNGSKIVLSSSRGQGNFRGLEASRPRTSKCVPEESNSDSNILIVLLKVYSNKKKQHQTAQKNKK